MSCLSKLIKPKDEVLGISQSTASGSEAQVTAWTWDRCLKWNRDGDNLVGLSP